MPHLVGVVVDGFDRRGDRVRVTARVSATAAACPTCGSVSSSVHGRYRRRLVDLAVGCCRVELELTVRRFRCRDPACAAVTFTEQVAGLTRAYARFTEPARAVLTRVGLALAGRAGARLAAALALPAGRSTLLRLVRAVPDTPLPAAPPVLGVDEFALRKGRVYGTVLVDIGTRRPLDLLADRQADTVAAWLRIHPGTQVLCRDRAGAYAEAGRVGAPDAVQVADRWHLWHNLAEAVEKCVHARQGQLRGTTPTTDPPQACASPCEQARPGSGTGRLPGRVRERHAQVRKLLDEGHSRRATAAELGLSRGTVGRYAKAASAADLLWGQWQNLPSTLDPHKPYLLQRLAEGVRNAKALHREITARGFDGGYTTVSAYVRKHRGPPPPPPVRAPSPRTAAGWITRRPEDLRDDESAALQALVADCPEIGALAEHVRTFADMMTHRRGERLDTWVTAASGSGLAPLVSFARGLLADYDGVRGGLTLPWSSGAVEGNINRIKMLKRQRYGRANLDLLRKRVLHAH